MLEVVLGGTGGMMPLVDRWLSCLFVELESQALLIDCGEGTQIALRAFDRHISRLRTILLTHLHADHVAGLPGLLLSMGNCGIREPVTVAGPKGTAQVVSNLLSIAAVPFPLRIGEFEEGESGEVELGGFAVSVLPLRHALPCWAYRLRFRRRPVFDPQKAEALGVPRTLFGTLHSGTPVEIDGRTVTLDMVKKEDRPDVTIVYCTDTSPFGSISDFAQNADLLICEGMHGDPQWREKTHEKGHMLMDEAARIAADAGAKELWLTHFSPANRQPEQYSEAVRAIFGNAVIGRDGLKKTLL